MRAAQVKPLTQSSTPATAGPQLVPSRETAPNEASIESTDREDPHPFVTVLIVAIVAVTMAFTFYSTLMLWVWFRNTGVNWMFHS